jgi:RNA polymerase sigma factor (TIGR02999 family)
MVHRETAMADEPGEITLLLQKVKEGQPEATDELIRLVYQELRRIAAAYLWKEQPGHTLQPTALINEAWLRLADQTRVDWRDRRHFFGVAAQMMRRVLVDHARAHLAGKRGGGAALVNLEMVQIEATPLKLEEILAIDEVLSRLTQFDPQVVEAFMEFNKTIDAETIPIPARNPPNKIGNEELVTIQ